MHLALLKGFTTSAGLIVAIGAQNAFVMRQGILRRHLFVTALLCSLIDATLILLGVLGFGQVISTYPLSLEIAKYFAVAFLLFYGAISLKSAFNTHALKNREEETMNSLKKTVFLLLMLSLLNPHVYLDTVILLGSIASQQPVEEKLYFTVGAILASCSWFFSLTYGSRLLAPFLQNSKAWKIIDCLVALTMWIIAITLLMS